MRDESAEVFPRICTSLLPIVWCDTCVKSTENMLFPWNRRLKAKERWGSLLSDTPRG